MFGAGADDCFDTETAEFVVRQAAAQVGFI